LRFGSGEDLNRVPRIIKESLGSAFGIGLLWCRRAGFGNRLWWSRLFNRLRLGFC
jgi:hypothetical protein